MKIRIMMRSNHGCWSCRIQRKKCDEAKPSCVTCTSQNITCHGYGNKPDWLDGGEQEKTIARDLKRQIGENRRKKRQRRTSHNVDSSPLPTDNTVSLIDDREVNPTEIPKDFLWVNNTSCSQSSALVSERLTSYREAELIMHYMDAVFPLQFRFHIPDARGRGWLLWLLFKSRPLYHAALSLSALHQSIYMPIEFRDSYVELASHHAQALTELRQFLRHIQESDHIDKKGRKIEVLSCGVSLISFELFQGVFNIDILQMAVDVDHLFGLSTNIPQYAYKDKRTFLAMRDKATHLFKSKKNQSQYIIFSGITKDIYYHDLDEELGIDSFIPNLEIILYKMPTRADEAIQEEFATMLNEKLMHMGRIHKSILGIGQADANGEDRTKRPDKSYLPIRKPNRKWPTLVVEVGFTEDLRKLQADARWWLSESNGDVRTVIIISDDAKKNEMTIEKWIFDLGPTRKYNTVVVEEVQGAKATNQNPLTIGFNDLLLRDPQGLPEQDIDFPKGDWEELADRVWTWEYAEE